MIETLTHDDPIMESRPLICGHMLWAMIQPESADMICKDILEIWIYKEAKQKAMS